MTSVTPGGEERDAAPGNVRGPSEASPPPGGASRSEFRPRSRFAASVRGGALVVDFSNGSISLGARELRFADLEVLEVRQGVFGASDGERWIISDLTRYADERGAPLISAHRYPATGGLSPRLVATIDELGRLVNATRGGLDDGGGAPGDGFPGAVRLRAVGRVDTASVVLGALGLGLFLWYEYSETGRLPLRPLVGGSGLFLLLVALLLAASFVVRRRFRLDIDAAGIAVRRVFGWRRLEWSRCAGFRHQGLEVELETDGRPLSFHLGTLTGDGAPLVLRRGVRPVLTPLGFRVLGVLALRLPELPQVPLFPSRPQRNATRLWVSALVAVNTAFFIASRPPGLIDDGGQLEFARRLIRLGARTEDSFDEPWRFLAALFLHGNLIHFLFNMLVVASVAPWIGRVFGWLRGTALYLGSGVLGNVLAHATRGEDEVLSIGASTAILGVIGALFGAILRRPLSLPLAVRARFRWAIPVVVGLTLGSGLAIRNLDNGAHFWGFVAGVSLVWLIPPQESRPTEELPTAPASPDR